MVYGGHGTFVSLRTGAFALAGNGEGACAGAVPLHNARCDTNDRSLPINARNVSKPARIRLPAQE